MDLLRAASKQEKIISVCAFFHLTHRTMSNQIALKAVSSRFLTKLRQKTRHDEDALNCCPHVFYHSVEHFIGHLLWALHPDRSCTEKKDKAQMDVIFGFLNKRRLCNVCRISIFAEFDVNILFKTFGVEITSFDDICHVQCRLCFRFWYQLFHHPQVPKLIIKSCSNNVFQYLCTMMEWMVQGILHFHNEQSDVFERGLVPYSIMIFRSINYWSLKDLQCYLKTHTDTIKSLVLKYASLQKNDGRFLHQDTAMLHLICILGRIALKCRTMGWKPMAPEDASVCASAIDFYKSQREKRYVGQWVSIVREDLLCGFLECSRPKDNAAAKCFKLCGGCKIVYYCSRSCQKRAWPQHKACCNRLSSRYAL